MTLTAAQIAVAARQGGFVGQDVTIATAIALAESGGNPDAHNTIPPDDSYGLWQINMFAGLGASRRNQFGLKSNVELYDPVTNARIAHTVQQQSGWKAWSTYTSGSYMKHLTEAQASGGTNIATPPSPSSDLGGISQFGGVLETPGTWWRLSYVIGGFVLLVMGATLVVKRTKGTGLATAVKKVAG